MRMIFNRTDSPAGSCSALGRHDGSLDDLQEGQEILLRTEVDEAVRVITKVSKVPDSSYVEIRFD